MEITINLNILSHYISHKQIQDHFDCCNICITIFWNIPVWIIENIKHIHAIISQLTITLFCCLSHFHWTESKVFCWLKPCTLNALYDLTKCFACYPATLIDYAQETPDMMVGWCIIIFVANTSNICVVLGWTSSLCVT